MRTKFSVEIDRYDPMALARVLQRLNKQISYWYVVANACGIDYGVFLNIDIAKKEIEICNCPRNNSGEDTIDDVIESLDDMEE